MKLHVRSMIHISLAASILSVAGLPPVLAAQDSTIAANTLEDQARDSWRETMHHIAAPEKGCFHASYPSAQWEKVECIDPPAYRSALPKLKGSEQTVGNAYDYVAQAPLGSLIRSAVGSFPTVTGVTSETGVNVPFGNGESNGILGANEYTVQINTNMGYTAACHGYTGCQAWQQYVISTNTPVSLTSNQLSGKTEVFIEYWLINYGASAGTACPSGFINGGANNPGVNCVQNTPAVVVYNGQLPIAALTSLQLSGSAVANGMDTATATYGTDAYTATVADSYTDISSIWTQAEFNVFGNAGGSSADFNSNASLTALIALTDGSTSAPSCVSSAGTTGETNNLNLINPCCTYAGKAATATTSATLPSIAFIESNASPSPTMSCTSLPKPSGIISTVAGGNGAGYSGDGGQATKATLQYNLPIAVDAAGNLYIADKYNQRVRKVTTSTGIITTVAGNGTQGYQGDGGLATSAELNYPNAVAVDAAGNLYIADLGNQRVRKVTASTGDIATIAGTGNYDDSGDGGLATKADVNISKLTIDSADNVYIVSNNRIRKITASTGIITTIAGNGTSGDTGDGGLAINATIQPYAIAVDLSGNVYFSSIGYTDVRKITASTGIITTIAGTTESGGIGPLGDGGPATKATLNFPGGLAVDRAGNVYIADGLAYRVRTVTASTGIIHTVAGNGTAGNPGAAPIGDGGLATSAVVSPDSVAVDSAGDLYVSDGENYSVRVVTP